MDKVNIRQARQRLSGLVAKAQKGGSTEITRRGRAVARISSVGVARRRKLPDLTAFRKRLVSTSALSRTVIESRRHERF
jgi:prevent-host-death family protein